MLEGVGYLKNKLPTLVVMNKKDLIKPGEIAKKLEVGFCRLILLFDIYVTAFTLYLYLVDVSCNVMNEGFLDQ